MRNIIIAILAVVFYSSCTNKARVSQLVFDESLTSAYINEEPFSGEAWSDDGKTICLSFEDGKIISARVFHENGNTALDGVSLIGESTVYDEEGHPMKLQDFIKNYPQLVYAIKRMVEGMHCKPSREDTTSTRHGR